MLDFFNGEQQPRCETLEKTDGSFVYKEDIKFQNGDLDRFL